MIMEILILKIHWNIRNPKLQMKIVIYIVDYKPEIGKGIWITGSIGIQIYYMSQSGKTKFQYDKLY